MKPKIFYRYKEVHDDVEQLYEKGITRGNYLGFEGLHELYSFKNEGTTYVYGAPFSGKTEFWFEMMMNLTELYGFHHAIYTPESGTLAEIYAELLSKRLKKPFYKNLPDHMNVTEHYKEKDFIDEYFFIIDPKDVDLTIEGFYSAVDDLEKAYKVKINTTVCDPFNELKHNLSGDSGRQDLYIENKLGFIRRDAYTRGRHNVILTHVADQEPVKMKDGTVYYPPATPRQIAGGQAWYRKAMNMICVWRPPAGITDPDTGVPFEDNETHIIINKYKPKGVGKKGRTKLYFDTMKNRYYEKFNGMRRYAGEQESTIYHQTQIIEPNPAALRSFTEPVRDENQDSPF